jgi:hypothetical protein
MELAWLDERSKIPKLPRTVKLSLSITTEH